MRFSSAFIFAAVTIPALVRAQDAATPIAETLVTGIKDRTVTLGAGTRDGVKPGAVYGITRGGRVQARVRVSATAAGESTAQIVTADDNFLITVGDGAQFLVMEAVPVEPPTPPTIPPTTPATTPQTTGVPMKLPTTSISTGETRAMALISGIENGTITIAAGEAAGVRTATNLPVVRDGNVIAIVRVQIVAPDSSTATVTWSDDDAGALQVGDGVQLMRAGTTSGAATGGIPRVIDTTRAPIPAAPIRYETGASNAVVPRADRTYDYLAALAADGLITSQPAWIFHDDGSRRHRTEEDITFTRAQIAEFVREASQSPRAAEASAKDRVALGFLAQKYARELGKIGVAPAALAPFARGKKFEFGISGQTRASFVGGDTNNYRPAFSERQGGRRSRSGLDSRTNLFARYGDNLEFSAQVDAGSDVGRNSNDRSYSVRRALLSYNANRLLKGLSVDLGRQEFWWGPGHFGTLLLGDTAGPLNSIHTTFKRGSYKLESLYAPLGNGVTGGGRSLYGHNLEIQLGSQTRVGFAETVLLPESKLNPALFAATFSPILLFVAERQTSENKSNFKQGNPLVQVYAETSIARGSTLHGELVIDDIDFNNNNASRNRVGTLVGARFFTPRDPAKLGMHIEYANLEGRTYLRFRDPSLQSANADYYYRGAPLGYPVAPLPGASAGDGLGGASSLRFDGYWKPASRLHLGVGIELADLNSELVVSRQQIFRFRAAYNVSSNITLVARAQRIMTSQPNFIVGQPTISQKTFQIELVRGF